MEKGVINSIKIEGVKGEGDYDLSDNKWDSSKSTAAGSYTVSFTEDEGNVVGQSALTGGENDKKVLMMIPQTLGDGAKVTINITPTDKSAVNLTFDLKDTQWVAGNHVTYLLSTTKIIKLDMGSVTYPQWQTAEGSAFTSEKLKSSYASGDTIGMYVVDKYNKVIEENLKFTYNGSKWTVEPGKKFKGFPQYNYFVYYPYQSEGLPGAPAKGTEATEENVASADNFFANAIDTWKNNKITADQSTLDKMNACDLQIGKASLDEDGCSVSFKMEHAMGLAVLNLESKNIAMTRRFKNNKYTFYYPDLPGRETTEPTKDTDYTDDATKQSVSASTNFSGYIPFRASTTANRYLQIVKPSTNISFKASDESGKPRTAWGTLTHYTFNVAKNTVMSKEIKTDADFYYLARVYTCTKKVEKFTAPVAGSYKMECWGAQGGGNSFYPGGKGSYTKGTITIEANKAFYIVVGQNGTNEGIIFNNGSKKILLRTSEWAWSGGGSTDIRFTIHTEEWDNFDSRKSRIMVAASGGGSISYYLPQKGIPGGKLNGFAGTTKAEGPMDGEAATFGTQIKGGLNGTGCIARLTPNYIGFGYIPVSNDYNMNGAGNGYYAGGKGNHGRGTVGVGATGSCFISGYPGCDAIKESSTENAIVHTGQPNHYSGLVFTDTQMIDGANRMPSPSGGTDEIGHSGDGACVISWFLK